jgi:DNA-binding transcriptional MerR regulator
VTVNGVTVWQTAGMGTTRGSTRPADTTSVDHDGPEELGLDELSTRSGVSHRTIRYYQSEGVLPRPRRDGREARYSLEHLERLELIGELQERGLKLEAIKDLVGSGPPRSVSEWLGIDEVLRTSWSNDRRVSLTLAEVHELLGRHPRRLVGELVDAGLLTREDDGSFVAPSRGLLDLTIRMLDAGVSIDIASRAAELLRRRMSKAADDLVALFEAETGRSFAGKGRPDEVAAALDVLRPIALDGAQLILAQELERSLRALAGRTAKKNKKR